MNHLTEIYVAVKDQTYIMAKIDNLCQKYKCRSGTNHSQQKALFKCFCHDTIEVFNNCFETSLLGIMRCKHKVNAYQIMNNLDIRLATLDIADMLWKLKTIVKSMTPINGIPSYKELIGLSADDIVAKNKGLVKNKIVRAGIGAMLIASKTHRPIHIEDVGNYYINCLSELNSEIKIKCTTISLIEQYLLDKFNAEIGYCNLALLKAGIGITKETKDLTEHIEKYESYQSTGNIVYINIIDS